MTSNVDPLNNAANQDSKDPLPTKTVPDAVVDSEDEGGDEEEEEVPIYAYVVSKNRRAMIGSDDLMRIMVKLTDTVESLKQKIEELKDVPADEQVLEFASHMNLDNSQTLKFYGLAHSAQIHVQYIPKTVDNQILFNRNGLDRQNTPENTRALNFRDGTVPESVSVQVQEVKWQEEKDGSQSLVLQPGAYLKCDLNLKANQGKFVNDYTIQMDIFLEKLPTKKLSLYSTAYPENKADGAVFINDKGSVGTLDEYGSDEVLEKDTWNRVVITCGGAWGSRTLCTYINGKRCTTIKKPILNKRDGPFALKTEGVLLFASNNLDHVSGVKVRFVDIRRFDLTPKDVVASRYENIVFSLWKKKQEEDEKSRKSKLCLGSIEDAPTPLWQDRSFFGQFCDPFVSNTELEGGLIGPSVNVLSHTFDRLLEREIPKKEGGEAKGAESKQAESKESKTSSNSNGKAPPPPPPPSSSDAKQAEGKGEKKLPELQGPPPMASLAHLLEKFDQGKFDILQSVATVLRRCRDMCKEFDLTKGEECLVAFVGAVRKQLSEMNAGDVMVVPGGWLGTDGGHAVMYSVECTSGVASSPANRLFRFVVSNTGQGLDYHPSTAHLAPKLKYKTNLAIDNVEDRKLADDVVWGLLLRLLYSANKHNTPSRLYELLIPFISDRPLEACIAETYNDPAIEWRSPQRAGSCYFRCVLEVFHYLLRRKGLSSEDTKLVSFAIRYQMILMLENDLLAVKSVRESDLTLIKFSAQQLAYAANKQPQFSALQLADIGRVVARVHQRLEALPCTDGNSVEPPPQLELELLPEDAARQQYALHPFFDRLTLPPDGVDGLAGTPTKDAQFVPLDFLQICPRAKTFADAVDALRICDNLCSLLDRQARQVRNSELIKVALMVHVFTEVVPTPLPRDGTPLVVIIDEEPECSTMSVVDRLARESPAYCLWETPMLYKDQLDLVMLLDRISLHLMTSAFNLHLDSLDGEVIIVMGCMLAIIDVVLRKSASDIVSPITQVLQQGYVDIGDGKPPNYANDTGKRKRPFVAQPFGMGLAYFAEQTRTIPIVNPMLLVARAAVIEYFKAQKTPERRRIFAWEFGNKPHGPTCDFVSEICRGLALTTDRPLQWLCGGSQYMAIEFNYPEFTILRDISFFFKFCMGTEKPQRTHRAIQFYSKLRWRMSMIGRFDVEVFETVVTCESANTDTRFPSNSKPSNLTTPDPCVTEDDVLHIPKLPDFADAEKLRVGMGQRDAELLVSYLTVPYLRIPLVAALFASEDRLHALQNRKLQEVFTSVLFEAGEYLPAVLVPEKKKKPVKPKQEPEGKNNPVPEKKEAEHIVEWPEDGIPTQVPTPNRQLLATPYGLLFNELARSPHAILTPLLALLKGALSMDSDNVRSGTLDLILYVIRVCACVDSYITTLVLHVAPQKLEEMMKNDRPADAAFVPPCPVAPQVLRGLRIASIDVLMDLWGQLRKLLRTKCRPLLDRGIAQAEQLDNTFKNEEGGNQEAENKQKPKVPRRTYGMLYPEDTPVEVDENIQLVCKLHAHRLLLYRNWHGPEALSMGDVGCIAASFIYINTRYSFSSERSTQLGVPNAQLFEMFQTMRRNIINAVERGTALQVSTMMAHVLTLISGQIGTEPTDSQLTETKSDGSPPTDSSSLQLWGCIVGTRNGGRYTVSTAETDLQGPAPVVPAASSPDVEINLQTAQLTLRTSHLTTLDGDVSSDPDVVQVFGAKCASMQCARIFNAQHCHKMRLVGRDHTVAIWDSDPRNCVQQNSRLYSPSNLHDTEMWIVPIFEPQRLDMRKQFLDTFLPYHLLMPGAPLKASANVVRLELIHPRKGVWKEVFIYRDPPMVNVFEVISNGRLFYRVLQYTSDARFALREMQERAEIRMPKPWEEWERYAAGWPSDVFDDGSGSIAIERAPEHPQNFAKAQELFIPPRLLYGLVPAALLDRYLFWQDPQSNIRGYPIIDEPPSHDSVVDDDETADDETTKTNDSLSQKVLDKIFIKLVQVKDVHATGAAGTCAQITRHPLTKPERQLYERLILQRQRGEDGEEGAVSVDLGVADDKASEDGQLVLLNLLHAPKGTALYSLARLLARVEHLSNCLCWTKNTSALTDQPGAFNVDLVEIPRLKLSFAAKIDDVGQIRLYSLDYAGMFVSNTRNVLSNHLLRGIPSSLLLANDRGESSILVPNVFPLRPVVATCPFSTELVLLRNRKTWNQALDSPCHLYQVHISMSFVQTPTLASALYLLLLRFAHRQYDDVVQLVNSCSIDTEFSAEESLTFQCLKYLNDDQHPDAHAVRAKISLAVLHSPVSLPWLLTQELTMYLMKISHVSATCRLSLQEERQLYDKVLENKTGDVLMDTEGPICVKSVRKKLFLCAKRAALHIRPQLGLECQWQIVKFREEQDGSAGVIALRYGPKNKSRFLSSEIGGGFRLLQVEGDVIPDTCKLRVREVKFDKKANLRVVTIQGMVSQKYLKVGQFKPFGGFGRYAAQPTEMAIMMSDEADANCNFYYGHATSFELVTPHIKNRFVYLNALADGREEAECTVDVCKATEVPDSDSDDDEESEPETDDEQEVDSKDEDNQAAVKAVGLQDSDGEDDEVKEGKKETKKEAKTNGEGTQATKKKKGVEKAKIKRGSWVCWDDRSALTATQSTWAPFILQYSVCQNLQGSMVLRAADSFWDMRETMRGSYNNMGFLFLYQVFAGAISVNVRSVENNGHSFASLLLQLFKDRHQKGLMQSILHICAHNPALCAELPKFTDNRGLVSNEIRGSKIAGSKDPVPLDQFFSTLVPMLVKMKDQLKWPTPVSQYPTIPKPPSKAKVVILGSLAAASSVATLLALDRSQRTPMVSDYHSPPRILSPASMRWSPEHDSAPKQENGAHKVEVEPGKSETDNLSVSQEELEDFASLPLRSIGLDQYVRLLSRQELKLPEVSSKMPFNVSHHPQAQTSAALAVLTRLDNDVQVYAAQCTTKPTPKMVGILDWNFTKFGLPELGAIRDAKILIQKLNSALVSLREKDEQLISSSIPFLIQRVNEVASSGESDAQSREKFILLRLCGQENFISLPYAIACLLSSKGEHDLRKVNPFLDHASIVILNNVIVATLLRANRVGLINRCLATIKDLIADLRALGTREASDAPVSKVDTTALAAAVQKADRLAEQLREERHYVSKIPNGKFQYDPRFLVFEFTWNLMLRKKQVRMVTDFMGAVTPQGPQQSSVKQLLMGAGKTTVITPLLALFLADGKSLVAVVVPPALLESSRAVLRSAFASIMQKRIYTFSCDRGSKVTPKLCEKLLDATRNRGVVMTTPVSIKSVMLKLLEILSQLLFKSEPSDNAERKEGAVAPLTTPVDPALLRDEACELASILRLFRNGRLIMDEVDLILHPLKSELNFPIGRKVALDFQPMRWQLAIHLVDSIFFAETHTTSVGFQESARALQILEKLKSVIEMGYAQRSLLSKPHLVLLNPSFYHRRMKLILAEWAQVWLEAQQMPELTRDEVVFYLLSNSRESDEDDGDDDSLPDVLNLRRSSSTQDMFSVRRNLPQIVRSKLPVQYRKMLNLARDYLQSYLPHILQKIDRVSFGMLSKEDIKRAKQDDPHMPISRTKLAVPFVGKDMPSQSSEYAHPDITIALTILAYRYEGLRWTDYSELISALRSRLNNEIGPYNERKSAVTYVDWVLKAGGCVKGHEPENKDQRAATQRGGDAEKVEVVPLRLLRLSALDQMKTIYKMWKQLPDSIHYYLTEFIFPQYMQHQVRKVSANGQAMGGDMLFLQRFGFSGTPSSLLPREFGACDYEKGADGLMLHTLTSPDVVSYELVPDDWTVSSLLMRIATAKRPQFHALIDTGALVTGLTNKQVAVFLLKHGLEGIEGVVFLDEMDRKVILVRSTGRIMQLAQCGISKEKRFSFYDQIHTTGTDIPQALDGVAVQTLGKDMTYRDYSQGAFRMRGIGFGQKIHLLVIPEVRGLIKREIAQSELPSAQHSDKPGAPDTLLVDISAWLVINTMKAESVQFNQLALQNLANVWRKAVFQNILTYQLKQLDEREAKKLAEQTRQLRREQQTREQKEQPESQEATLTLDEELAKDAKEEQEEHEDLAELKRGVAIFRETIDFSVHDELPVTITFNQVIAQTIQAHAEFITTPEDKKVCAEIQTLINSMVERALKSAEAVASLAVPTLMKRQMSYEQGMLEDTRYNSEQLNIEMVQARIQERENEKTLESEREIEIEKYVDLAYRRDREVPVPWEFSRLSQKPNTAAMKHIYPLSQFSIAGSGVESLGFPSDLHVSCNYFDLSWTGNRRVKNATIALDWVPSLGAVENVKGIADYSMTPEATAALDMALTWFAGAADATHIRQSTLKRILKAVLGRMPSAADVAMFGMQENGSYLVSEVKRKLVSGFLWDRQAGRHFVLLSLAEAETIRRVMHLRSDRGDAWVIPNTDAVMSLRNVIDDFSVVDCSQAEDMKNGDLNFQENSALQSMRFFDSQMFYKDDQLMSLLRALQINKPDARRQFFFDVISCRRRVRHKHEETPLHQVLSVDSESEVLRLHGLIARVQDLIQFRGLVLSQAFLLFDHDRNGLLTGSELWGGLHFLGLVDLNAADVLQLLGHMDTDRDGNISLPEFEHALRKQIDTGLGVDDTQGSNPVQSDQATVEPRGAAELLAVQKANLAAKLALEEKEKKQKQGFERARLFRQQCKLLEERLSGGPNPRKRDKYGVAIFDLSRSLLPTGVQILGSISLVLDKDDAPKQQEAEGEAEEGEAANREMAPMDDSAFGMGLEGMPSEFGFEMPFSPTSFPMPPFSPSGLGVDPLSPSEPFSPSAMGGLLSPSSAFSPSAMPLSPSMPLPPSAMPMSPSGVPPPPPPKPSEGKSESETKTERQASYVVQQLRRPHSLVINPQAYIYLPIPFAKNGGGRHINLYSITMVVNFASIPEEAQPLIQTNKGNDEPAQLYLTKDGEVIEHQEMKNASAWGGMTSGQMSSGKLKTNTWQILTVTVDCLQGKITSYVDGDSFADPERDRRKMFYAMQNQTDRGDCDGPLSLSGAVLLFASSDKGTQVNARLKTVHFATQVLSASEVRVLSNKLIPTTVSWVCVGCEFHNPPGSTSCKRCLEPRKAKGKSGAAWRCHCGILHFFAVSCVNCGAAPKKHRRRNPRTWMCGACRSNNLALNKSCTICGAARPNY